MAIEMHHLNTHGMMEYAGKVLDGVVRLKARIAELEKENQTLAEDVSDKIESITELMELVKKYKSEKAELEEERRWRKFPDEKPSEEMEGIDFIVSNGFYSVVCEWRWYWNNEPFCGDKNCDVVKYWMPLPSAPKDGK
jgi:hypothetical protein